MRLRLFLNAFGLDLSFRSVRLSIRDKFFHKVLVIVDVELDDCGDIASFILDDYGDLIVVGMFALDDCLYLVLE